MNNLKIEALNTEQAQKVSQRLKANNDYCPCKIVKNDNTKCMCKEFRDSILNLKKNETITCHCGLYQAHIES